MKGLSRQQQLLQGRGRHFGPLSCSAFQATKIDGIRDRKDGFWAGVVSGIAKDRGDCLVPVVRGG